MSLRIGIDLGGTKIEAAVLDRSGEILERRRVATPAGDYAATLQAVADLAAALEKVAGGPCSIGIATPGTISPHTGLLRNSNSVCLNGQPFKQDIERRLKREVRIENDANCFALSESVDGAGRGAAVVFGVILGTGVGGGIVVDGRVLQGANGIAGEWGHNPMPWPQPDEWPGPDCYCGRSGCIETFLSGPGLAADHVRAGGAALSADQIVLNALKGDPVSERCVVQYVHRLARSLASVINLLDPDVIVLGGGLSNVSRWYAEVPELWSRWIFSEVIRSRLVPNLHGDSSGVRGAAWLWEARA